MADVSVWIVTGMSGAGKATALTALEVAGIECVDNLPVSLLAGYRDTDPQGSARIRAAVIDARQGDALQALDTAECRILFLDADEACLKRRLGNSLRPHPMAAAGGISSVTWPAERTQWKPIAGCGA